MEIKFFTEKGVLDLSSQKISFQESNSKLSDKSLTKFTFPFEVYIDENFIHHFGDYYSHESRNLDKSIKGMLLFEGKIHEAILEIVSIEGRFLTGQIDFGFEEIPNYDKKLADLPLEKFDVPDIHTYAIDVCKKKYPETNFNFPRIHTKKYNPSNVMWDAFDGYYNETSGKGDTLAMKRNVSPTEQNNWTIDNVNIIHPCPHILYLLKVGFQDAGYTLGGDILTDENLQQRWVFSGGQYFRNKWILSKEAIKIERNNIKNSHHYREGRQSYTNNTYSEKTIIEKPDKYRLDFSFSPHPLSNLLSLQIKINGQITNIPTYNETNDFAKTAFIDITQPNSELEVIFVFKRTMRSGTDGRFTDGTFRSASNVSGNFSNAPVSTNDFSNAPISDKDKTYILILKIRSKNGFEDEKGDSEETKIVENENHIDLSRAVPDMTFSELVGIVQNWFNYDLKINDRTVYMDRIGITEALEGKDFREYEVKSPKRNLLVDKSYLIKFTELDDGYVLDAMYYDKHGAKINGKAGEDTSTIEIKGYPMPIGKAKEAHTPTAQVKKDSDTILALVYYDGLVDGINNATNPPGCTFPELFTNNWEKWLSQRISSEQYQWKFLADIQTFSSFNIYDYLFCYQKKHIIKTMNKDKISDNTYEVEIITEII